MKTTYKNEQLKRRFYEWLKASKGFSEETIRCYEKAIWLWEDFTNKDDFGSFKEMTYKMAKERAKIINDEAEKVLKIPGWIPRWNSALRIYARIKKFEIRRQDIPGKLSEIVHFYRNGVEVRKIKITFRL